MTAPRTLRADDARAPQRPRDRSAAGLLLLVSGAAVVLGIMTAEALYPARYEVHRNTVSDLAAMRPEDVVRQPSAAIFNTTMIVCGVLIVAAAVLLHRSRAGLLPVLAVAGLGIGMVGVGLFPGNTVMAVHQLVSIATFLCGGLAAILTARLSARALRPVHLLLGGVALAFLIGYLVLGDVGPFDRLGEGGVERWIVYPVVLWIVVFGAGLAASPSDPPAA
ncbi:hypothetical membrane protein [Blastococcus aggregatus]|uniref:Hypothetical membrane protein n=1 Tax=Blastococcus aggregatus TaxID=38502 RepID=A0A285V950_9ACTN|nr:DUF998 domain-containing protein [Blastococcus aggregatus]SOC49576.1 hypothetical membrane protein [Blastococcus aggregatus]